MNLRKTRVVGDLALLLLATVAYACSGWRWNMALAGLVAPTLLMRYFRGRKRWYETFTAYPLLALASIIILRKGWDLSPLMKIALPCVIPIFQYPPLLLDRWANKRLGSFAASLVFPASVVALDYAVSFTPLATTISGAVGLYGLRELAQLASLTGIWGLGFLARWLASAINAFIENKGDLRAAGAASIVPLALLGVALAYGAFRVGTNPVGSPTVRVAGVSVEHPHDYWNLIDVATPKAETLAIRPETDLIEERLFEASERAASVGAKLIVWAEGACVLNQDEEAAFITRAGEFTRRRGVYLAAGVLVLHYGSKVSDNKVLMFTPEGKSAFTYIKTISWYPSESDGVLKVVETPYGRIGTAICFDMDTPSFARKLSRIGADIVLVPAYDSERIRPYHTEVSLFRAVENGYSVFRQVAEGTSMAVDGRGIVRGMQDYFANPDRLFIADLPTRAERTLYGAFGDYFAWADLVLLCLLSVALLRKKTT